MWLQSDAASSHDAGTTGYARITVEGRSVRYFLKLPAHLTFRSQTPADAVAGHVAVEANGSACVAVPGAYHLRSAESATIEIGLLFACPTQIRELKVVDRLDRLFGPDHHTIADIDWPGGSAKSLLENAQRTISVALATKGGPSTSASEQTARGSVLGYLGVGVEHILLGFDHLLFILALVLPGGRLRTLFAIITAFTVAHSLTLGLSVLGIVRVPGRIVEPLIALSIAYVAIENVYPQQALSRRWAVGFFFGLVHGLGFAGALAELGLPASGVVAALFGFNLGVEAGQAFVIVLLLPLLTWLHRQSWDFRVVRATSMAIVGAGVILLVERLMG